MLRSAWLGDKTHEELETFIRRNPPQMVIEIERSHDDADKPDVYRFLGVDEMWRINETVRSRPVVEIPDL